MPIVKCRNDGQNLAWPGTLAKLQYYARFVAFTDGKCNLDCGAVFLFLTKANNIFERIGSVIVTP